MHAELFQEVLQDRTLKVVPSSAEADDSRAKAAPLTTLTRLRRARPRCTSPCDRPTLERGASLGRTSPRTQTREGLGGVAADFRGFLF